MHNRWTNQWSSATLNPSVQISISDIGFFPSVPNNQPFSIILHFCTPTDFNCFSLMTSSNLEGEWVIKDSKFDLRNKDGTEHWICLYRSLSTFSMQVHIFLSQGNQICDNQCRRVDSFLIEQQSYLGFLTKNTSKEHQWDIFYRYIYEYIHTLCWLVSKSMENNHNYFGIFKPKLTPMFNSCLISKPSHKLLRSKRRCAHNRQSSGNSELWTSKSALGTP